MIFLLTSWRWNCFLLVHFSCSSSSSFTLFAGVGVAFRVAQTVKIRFGWKKCQRHFFAARDICCWLLPYLQWMIIISENDIWLAVQKSAVEDALVLFTFSSLRFGLSDDVEDEEHYFFLYFCFFCSQVKCLIREAKMRYSVILHSASSQKCFSFVCLHVQICAGLSAVLRLMMW